LRIHEFISPWHKLKNFFTSKSGYALSNNSQTSIYNFSLSWNRRRSSRSSVFPYQFLHLCWPSHPSAVTVIETFEHFWNICANLWHANMLSIYTTINWRWIFVEEICWAHENRITPSSFSRNQISYFFAIAPQFMSWITSGWLLCRML